MEGGERLADHLLLRRRYLLLGRLPPFFESRAPGGAPDVRVGVEAHHQGGGQRAQVPAPGDA